MEPFFGRMWLRGGWGGLCCDFVHQQSAVDTLVSFVASDWRVSGAGQEPYKSSESDATFADAGSGCWGRLVFRGSRVGGCGKLE